MRAAGVHQSDSVSSRYVDPEPPVDHVLRVEGLQVSYATKGEPLRAVRDLDLHVGRGEILGLVGESGSGKSTVLSALMRLLPPGARLAARRMDFAGLDLLRLKPDRMRQLRGRRVGLVPQRPMTSLSPVTPIRRQLQLLAGPAVSPERLDAILADVGLGSVRSRLNGLPHEFSGGQLQRMLIAVAVLAHEPELVLADEPTTTLDATVQAQVLSLLLDLRERIGNSMIFVSHDLGVISQMCDRVGVMYGGLLVEVASVRDAFTDPQHPYLHALLDAVPGRHAHGERLRAIPGTVSGSQRLPGCPFAPRCERATGICATEMPPPRRVEGSTVRCHHPGSAR